MKKRNILAGIPALALVLGFVIAGCDNESTNNGVSVDGTSWEKDTNYVLSFTGSNFILKEGDTSAVAGTYSFSGGDSGTFTMTTGTNSGTATYTITDTTLTITNSNWSGGWAKMTGTYTKQQ